MKEKKTQLATRIDPKKKQVLDSLHKKTHISIRHLIENAITLLDQYYKHLQKNYEKETVDHDFFSLLEYSMKKHDTTYKKLSK